MAFDHDLAQSLLRKRDRDTAPFFAGRSAEIHRFDDALIELEERPANDPAATFLIYQGAPGCGKTSLIAHLRERRSNDELSFATVRPEDFANPNALIRQILHEIEGDSPTEPNVVSGFAPMDASRRKPQHRTLKVVLHLDEAQEVESSAKPGLTMLHTKGLGLPCVLVLTGLSHTHRKLVDIGAVSRLARNAVVNMGAMSEDECAESCRMMLEQLRVVGDEAARDQTARMVAVLSHGWPQHLNGAQVALCRELLRTNGVLYEVDPHGVRQASDRMHYEYYDGRLFNSILGLRQKFTLGVIEKIAQRPPANLEALDALCQEEMARRAWGDTERSAKITSGMFADALVEKGVVAITPDDRYDLAASSMVEWAASRGDDPPSAPPT